MNFKELIQPKLITAVCPIGSGVEMTVDVNKYVGECYRRMARTYRERGEQVAAAHKADGAPREKPGTLREAIADFEALMEVSAVSADVSVAMYADILASDRYGIIDDWRLDDNIPPTFENLMQLDVETLKFFFDWGRDIGNPKGQGDQTKNPSNLTTPETTSDGSSDQTTLSAASPTM